MSTHKRSFWQHVLDTFFPQEKYITELEKISLETLRETKRLSRNNLPQWINAPLTYQDKAIRTMVWYMKYKGNQVFLRRFAEILTEDIFERTNELLETQHVQEIYIIPIPMTAKKKRKRQYNQTELLAKKICQQNKTLTYKPYILKKIHETKSQTKTRNRQERLKNIRGAFNISKTHKISGQTIFLIDDVTTTGATLKEARRVLREAGAKRVEAFVIAH